MPEQGPFGKDSARCCQDNLSGGRTVQYCIQNRTGNTTRLQDQNITPNKKKYSTTPFHQLLRASYQALLVVKDIPQKALIYYLRIEFKQ
jgi:hypothetical protein